MSVYHEDYFITDNGWESFPSTRIEILAHTTVEAGLENLSSVLVIGRW